MALIIDTGTVTLSDTIDGGVDASVSFSQSFSTTPAVVTYIVTRGGGQSIQCRAKNVTTSGFDVHMEEPDNEAHATEDVSWVAMRTGKHEIDGTKFEAGIHTTSTVRSAGDGAQAGDQISFNQSWSEKPAVVHNLQTYNNSEFMATQANSVDTTNYKLSQEALETGHETNATTEDIGWIAVEPTVHDDFEDNDLSEWTTNVSASTVTDRVANGQHSMYTDTGNSGAPIMERTFWSGGKQINSYSYLFQETINSTGAGIRFKNSNGNYELGVATDNPQWEVDDGNGVTQVNAANGYDRWIRFTVIFDWANSQYDIHFRDYSAGTVENQTGRSLKNGTDVETIELWDYSGGSWGGTSIVQWWDDLSPRAGIGSNSFIHANHSTDGADDGVDDSPHSILYSNYLGGSTPDVVVSGNSMNGNTDGYYARSEGTNNVEQHNTYAEEDQVNDSERSHTGEIFGYVAFSSNTTVSKLLDIGGLKLQTGSGTIDVPVLDTGTSGSNVHEFWRVETDSGTGYVPLTDYHVASNPELRTQTANNGLLALHDSNTANDAGELTVRWETTADWDSGQSDTYTVHESVTNTDHTDSTIVQQGYNYTSPLHSSDLKAFWPLHEDSGTTANDISGNGNHGTIGSDVDMAEQGILSSTAALFSSATVTDGVIDTNTIPPSSGPFTFIFWINPENTNDSMFCGVDGISSGEGLHMGPDGSDFVEYSVGGKLFSTSQTYSKASWYMVAMTFENGTANGYWNGTNIASFNTSYSQSTSNIYIGAANDNSGSPVHSVAGKVAEVMVYDSVALTSSEIQRLYDVVTATNTHKTFAKQL